MLPSIGRRHGTGPGQATENREYPGSSHFFFDIGNGNLLAFFDSPGLDVGPYAEVLGGLHQMAISMEPERWQEIVPRFDDAGVECVIHSEVPVYFTDPDGARIELIADPLGEMYGSTFSSPGLVSDEVRRAGRSSTTSVACPWASERGGRSDLMGAGQPSSARPFRT